MAIQSKNKGNTFERKIANMLSKQFQPHTGIEQAFRRNADSGSFFGGSNQRRTQTHDTEKATFGDIVVPADFNFSIECKHYKTPPTFVSLVKQENSVLDEWIKQGTLDATSSGKHMLLISKFNLVPEVAIVESSLTTLKPIILYKGYSVIPLAQFLEQPISYFFMGTK